MTKLAADAWGMLQTAYRQARLVTGGNLHSQQEPG